MGQTLPYMIRDDVLRGTCRAILAGLQVLLVFAANSKDWYAAPDAKPNGQGTLESPWPLHVALAQSATIRPGDTLHLRGGHYRGPAFNSSLAGTASDYITVRSYPGEWAVVTDGLPLTIGAALPVGVNGQQVFSFRIPGSEHLPDGGFWIRIGSEVSYIYNKSSSNIWTLNRGYRIASHSAGEAATLEGNFIQHTGSHVQFMDFEITATVQTNRVVDTSQGDSDRVGLNFVSSGKGNKAVNLVIHNVGHPAIGFWNQQQGGEINGCIFWGNGIYDRSFGGAPRGNAVYAQNDMGTVFLQNNIVFRNLTKGLEAYGETGPANGFRFYGNIAFSAPGTSPDISFSTGSRPMTNNIVSRNYVLGTIHGGYVGNSNRLQIVTDNIMVDTTVSISRFVSGTFSNNTCFLKHVPDQQGIVHFSSPDTSKQIVDLYWDRNSYYMQPGTPKQNFSLKYQGLIVSASNGGGNLFFDHDGTNSWKAWSGFDSESSLTEGWPTNYLKVVAQPTDYDSNRIHICVISTTGQATAPLDLSTLGFVQGQDYELRDAQDYFTVVASDHYRGGNIELPLHRTEVSAIPGITHYTNKHTNVDKPGLFNAFVLRRLPATAVSRVRPSKNLRVLTAIP